MRGVVLLLHGGRVRGRRRPSAAGPATIRMYSFQIALDRAGRSLGLATAVVGYRHTGWNDADPVPDGAAAVAEVRSLFGDVPVCLVGHSMGGRVAVRIAREPDVVGVLGLAPWLPPGEPPADLGQTLTLLAHGDCDRTTDPALTFLYARDAAEHGARVAALAVRGGEHKLLRRGRYWHRLTVRFALGVLGLAPVDAELAELFARPPAERVRVPV